ncbi:MAG: PqqD family protein [Lachnospiraceae bacterium]|nr:PqqD family protein [Lachnospiraceae bacterium]
MKKEAKIKLLKKLDVTDLAGEKVMIDFQSGKYFLLKGAANDIWDMLDDGVSIGYIKEKLLEVYDIDGDTCNHAVDDFLEKLKKEQFIDVIYD